MILRRFLLAVVVGAAWGYLAHAFGIRSIIIIWVAGIVGLLCAIGLEPPRRRKLFKFGGAPLAPAPTVNLTGATKISGADIPSGGEAVRGCADLPAGRPLSNYRRIP